MLDLDSAEEFIVRDCAVAGKLDAGQRTKLKAVGGAPRGLLCSACGELLTEPIQSSCGERYCEQCFKTLVKSGDNPICPVCYEKIDRKLCWPDAFAAKEVSQLAIHCINLDAGCTWSGTKKELEAHLRQCESRLEECSNSGCSLMILPSSRDKHISEECLYRPVECQHCSQSVAFISLEKHFETCPKVLVSCEKCDKQEIPREEVRNVS
jgi:hypothetical protein